MVRTPDLKSGDSGFKSRSVPLAGVVLGCPEFNSSAKLVKKTLTGLPPAGWDFLPCYVRLRYLFHHLIPETPKKPH